METPREYYYTYYSYEEWGKGYIGSRGCECLPEEDVKYFGSFKDKSFRPTQKIILEIYETREEAIEAEIILHDFYDVANNPHFANRAKQTSTKFYYIVPFEEASKRGKINGLKHKQNKTGVCGRSKEQMSKDGGKGGKVGGKKTYELGIGIHSITPDQRIENSRKGGEIGGEMGGNKAKELGLGIHALTSEQKSQNGKKGGKIGGKIGGKKVQQIHKQNGTGFYGLNSNQRKEYGKRGGSISGNQKWECLETGFIANPGNLTKYQKKQGIDISKRKRVA